MIGSIEERGITAGGVPAKKISDKKCRILLTKRDVFGTLYKVTEYSMRE